MRKIGPFDRSSEVEDFARAKAGGAGDVGYVRRMLVEYVPVLREVARGLCRDDAKVDDLVQDVLERALRSVDAIDLERNPRGWMVTILHNLHIDRCRQQARQGLHISCDGVAIATPEAAAEPVWSSLTAEDVERAAKQIPAELREVYVMFAFEGRSYVEISAALGIPKATVGTRVLRARAHLRKLLVADMAGENA